MSKEIESVLERKSNLEYSAMMMLRRLHTALPLRSLILQAKRDFPESEREELVAEFFGTGEQDGSDEANGYTIPRLLEEWQEVTEEFLSMVGR